MVKKKKILIVSPTAFGYIDYLVEELKKYDRLTVDILYLNYTEYRNLSEKLINFFSKTFLGINLKKNNHFLQKDFKAKGFQDEVLIIRPDLISNQFLETIKKQTLVFKAFYFDSAQRLIRKQQIIHFFDKVYSFDKSDVEKYKFEFITNYIFMDSSSNNEPDYLFFNISGNDDEYRFLQLENFAKYLKSKNWSFKFISFHQQLKMANRGFIQVVDEVINVDKAAELIKKCRILVEFQRYDQIGLSFRVFEALGMKKKLITTNVDIVTYDFYHPQNILVIDKDNYNIPDEFVSSPYVDIDDSILQKYKVKNWVKQVFEV